MRQVDIGCAVLIGAVFLLGAVWGLVDIIRDGRLTW